MTAKSVGVLLLVALGTSLARLLDALPRFADAAWLAGTCPF